MSHNEDSQRSDFIQASVERDQPRVIDATQLTNSEPGQPPYPGAERVLKVTVPVEPELTEDFKLALPIDPNRSDEIYIDPCGYVQTEFLERDDYLQQLLIQTPTVDGPRISGTGRQLVNIDLPLLQKLRDGDHTDVELPEKKEPDQLQTFINIHKRAHIKIQDFTDNAVGATVLQSKQPFDSMPVRSVIYNELYAMVEERIDHPNITMRLGINRYRKQAGSQEQTLALEILKWLRERPVPERFSYQQISELLTAAEYADYPIHFLTFALYDLATGMPLADVLYNGQYFEYADTHPKTYYDSKDRSSMINQNKPLAQLYEQTMETVSYKTDQVIKEWWVSDPPTVYPLPVIRHILLHRDISSFSHYKFNRPYIPTTGSRTIRSPDETIGVGFRYQNPRNELRHPYRLAMAGDDTFRKAIQPAGPDAFWEYKQKTVNSYLDHSSMFGDIKNLADWLTGAAPTDIDPDDIIRWFQ